MLHGIALAQAGRPDEGLADLRRATMLAPDDPETFYNLAVQLYDEGDRVEAASAAKQALVIAPNHGRAQELVNACDAASGSEPFEAGKQKIQPTPQSLRRGPDDPLPHMLGLGEPWTYIGYGVLALCVLETVLLVIHPPAVPKLRTDGLSVAVVALCIFNLVFGIFWMAVDLFDRNKKFVWLLPQSVFALVGLPAVFLALYLWMGRRNTGLLA